MFTHTSHPSCHHQTIHVKICLKAWFPPMRLTYSHNNKLISLMILTIKIFYRIKISNLMCSHQTSRTSQISHFRIKYEVCISFKKINLRKARQKNRSSQPEVLCNTCARVSFLIKLQATACNFIKKVILTQVFSCEFSGISKNTFFYRTIPVAASEKR